MYWSLLGIGLATVLVGCASTPPGVVHTTPARADAFKCTKDLLTAWGYDLQVVDGAAQTLEAEVRRNHAPTGATREIITASVSSSPDVADVLQVRLRAFDYRMAEHSLPINRQTVVEVRPSDAIIADGEQVLTSCGA